MYRCAAEQGHANAAKTLGIDLKTDKKYAEGINALQLGVKFGSYVSAGFLEKGFKTIPPDDGMYYMALKLDPERSRRYQQIGSSSMTIPIYSPR